MRRIAVCIEARAAAHLRQKGIMIEKNSKLPTLSRDDGRVLLSAAGYPGFPPLFRAAGFVDRDGRVRNWLLWDGEREWRIDRLSSEQRKLPIRAVVNDTLLVEWIEEGWTPEKDRR